MLRKSEYAMMDVEDAIVEVLKASDTLLPELVPLMDCVGRRCFEEVEVKVPHPMHSTSIMDGYAVRAPLQMGKYEVLGKIRAGDISSARAISENQIAYITTGAALPEGSNAVIKIEDTECVEYSSSDSTVEKVVQTNRSIDAAWTNVRQPGTDMAVGDVLLQEGQIIGSAEIGLLAQIGMTKVNCYAQPRIGVMSTGNELIDILKEEYEELHDAPIGHIRDSNRVSLLSALKADGYKAIDLGIARDTMVRGYGLCFMFFLCFLALSLFYCCHISY